MTEGSWLAYVGFGGAAVCCLALELLGGAALLGGIAGGVGLSTGMMYLLIVGLGGVLAVLLAVGYLQVGIPTSDVPSDGQGWELRDDVYDEECD